MRRRARHIFLRSITSSEKRRLSAPLCAICLKKGNYMKSKFLFIFIFAISFFFLNLSKDDEFKQMQKKMNITFIMPDGFKKIKEVKQHDVLYYIGYKNPKFDSESRISLWSEDDMFPKIKKLENEDEIKNIIESFAETIMMNIIQSRDVNLENYFYDDSLVKEKFGGDFGLVILTEWHSDFTKGYKHIHMICIYKKNYV